MAKQITGQVFLNIDGPTKVLNRRVRSGEEVRLTYYPTGSYSDEEIVVTLRRGPDGDVRVWVEQLARDNTKKREHVMTFSQTQGEAS